MIHFLKVTNLYNLIEHLKQTILPPKYLELLLLLIKTKMSDFNV